MKFKIKRPESRDDIYEIEEKAEERLDADYNDKAALRYMANDYSEVLFKLGDNIRLSFDRPSDEPGVTLIKVEDYQDDGQLKAEVVRQKEKRDQKTTSTYGDSKVVDSFDEALEFIEDKAGVVVNRMIDDGLVYVMG